MALPFSVLIDTFRGRSLKKGQTWNFAGTGTTHTLIANHIASSLSTYKALKVSAFSFMTMQDTKTVVASGDGATIDRCRDAKEESFCLVSIDRPSSPIIANVSSRHMHCRSWTPKTGISPLAYTLSPITPDASSRRKGRAMSLDDTLFESQIMAKTASRWDPPTLKDIQMIEPTPYHRWNSNEEIDVSPPKRPSRVLSGTSLNFLDGSTGCEILE